MTSLDALLEGIPRNSVVYLLITTIRQHFYHARHQSEARKRCDNTYVYGKPIVAIFNTIIQFQFNEIQVQFNEIQVQFNEIQVQFNEIQFQFNEIQFQFNENSSSIE